MARTRHAKRGNLPAARNGTIGQPSKLTPVTEDAIIHAVLNGNHLTTAASAAGIAHRTLYRWLEQADIIEAAIEQGKPYDEDGLPYLHFRQRLADARAQAEMTAVQVVMKAMKGGNLISERPVQRLDGEALRGDDGKILMDRTWSQPDGRLALTYLARSRPGDWGQNGSNRLEVTGAGGGPVQVEHSGDQIASLSERLHQVAQQRKADADDAGWDDEPEDTQDVEIVDESEGQ